MKEAQRKKPAFGKEVLLQGMYFILTCNQRRFCEKVKEAQRKKPD